jgi:hypothetical protein
MNDVTNILLTVMFLFYGCSTDKRESGREKGQNSKSSVADDIRIIEVTPKVGCRDIHATDVMKSQFEQVGYIVDQVKTGGRHGTVGEIHVTVNDEQQLKELTRQCKKIIESFADINQWYSFDIYITLDSLMRRKIILLVLTDVKMFGSGLKYQMTICDFDSNGHYNCD